MPVLNWAIDIDAAPEVVFDALADQRNEMSWSERIREVEMLTPEPVGVGSRFRARWAGSPANTITYTTYERPNRWTAESRSWMLDLNLSLTVEPNGSGSRFASQWDFALHGPLRLLTPVLVAAFQRDVWKSIQSAKDYVESLNVK